MTDRDHGFGTPEHFRAWLESHPDDKPVGMGREGCRCPVAHYFESEYNCPAIVMPLTGWVTLQPPTLRGGHENRDVRLASWLSTFAHELDNAFMYGQAVSKAEAIALLEAHVQ